MMLKNLQRLLRKEKKHKDILDIVLYGSLTRATKNPGDIDLAVIFTQGSLKERLARVQEMKRHLKTLALPIDMKGILVQELFEPRFFARSGLVHEGISLFDGKHFARKLGFIPAVMFFSDLQGKSHAEKVKFHYVLRGRGTEGMLSLLQGIRVAPGVYQLPTETAAEFKQVLKRHKVKFHDKKILLMQ